jgi:hypothetical protein
VGSPAILASPSACASLLPADWANGVAHTDLPAAAPAMPQPAPGHDAATLWQNRYGWALDEQKKWASFGVSEANKLDQANGRTADAIGIVERCEARDAAAVNKARPKVLGIF